MAKTKTLECPECAADVELADDVMAGEIISCSDCAVELEVFEESSSFTLRPAPEEEEDWGE